VYGARPLKRYLQREVETRLGRKILAGEIPGRSTVHVDVRDGLLNFDVAPRAEVLQEPQPEEAVGME